MTPAIIPAPPTPEVICELSELLRRRISLSRLALCAWVPFFGSLVLKLDIRASNKVSTACVSPNGLVLLSEEFCAKLKDSELTGLLIHEVLHPALFYWGRFKSRTTMVRGKTPDGRIIKLRLSNLAHDHSLNLIIRDTVKECGQEAKIALPPSGCLDDRFAGMSGEEVYDILAKEIQSCATCFGTGVVPLGWTKGIQPGPGKCGDCKRDHNPGSRKTVTHEVCPDCYESGDGEGGEGDGPLVNIPGGYDNDCLEGEGEAKATPQQEQEWKIAVVAAAQNHQKRKGNMPGWLKKLVDELTNPRIAWQDVLARWIGEHGKRQDYSYRRPSRRSESVGEFLPSFFKDGGIDDVIVLWDTSGSMNGREKEILGDVQSICVDCGLTIRIICCDTRVCGDFREVKDALSFLQDNQGVPGGGGSDFNPAFDQMETDQFNGVVVCFTDGCIGVPGVKPPLIKEVLWCLTKQDSDPTGGRWGEVLYIPDEKE